MKVGLGLLVLLISVAILLVLTSEYTIPVARQGKQTREQVAPIAGYEQDGTRIMDSIDLAAVERGGQLRGLQVNALTPTGIFATGYGLTVGDVIVGVGQWERVRDVAGGADMAIPLVQEAPQRSWPIFVERNGQTQRLTPTSAAGNIAATPPPPGNTPAPTNSPGPASAIDRALRPLQRQ